MVAVEEAGGAAPFGTLATSPEDRLFMFVFMSLVLEYLRIPPGFITGDTGGEGSGEDCMPMPLPLISLSLAVRVGVDGVWVVMVVVVVVVVETGTEGEGSGF